MDSPIAANTSRPWRFAVVAALLAATALAQASCRGGRRTAGLNVLVVTLDTLRADRLGSYGYAPARTPVLDTLADRGIRFANAATTTPLTLPSHASLFTGLYPPTHGVRDNGIFSLPESIPTLTERFRQAGYRTGAVVAASVLNREYGLARGFDSYDDMGAAGSDPLGASFGYAERDAVEITDTALEWLEAGEGERFFLWAHYFDCHAPYLERPGTATRDDRYDAEIAHVDGQLGRLLAALERSGRLDSTIVVVVADHGEALGQHGEETHGVLVYDEVMRIPMLLWVPGGPREARVVDGQVSLVDLAPTLLSLVGLPALEGAQGRDLSAVVLDGAELPEDRSVFLESELPRLELGWSALQALRSSRWKYIRAPRPELYDLRADPGERNNVFPAPPSDELAETLAELEETLTLAGAEDARRELTDEQLAQLQSLGYLGSLAPPPTDGEQAPWDPKDVVSQLAELDRLAGLVTQGRFADALPGLERLAAPDSATRRLARQNLVVALIRAGELERAGRLAQEELADIEAAGLPPMARLRPLILLAQAHLGRGELEQALAHFDQALVIKPDAATLAWDRAAVLARMGRHEEALAGFDLVIGLLPREEAVRYEAAATAVEAGDFERAAVLGRVSGGPGAALPALGAWLAEHGQPAAAVRVYRKLIEERPRQSELHLALGAALMQQERHDEARASLARATELAPQDPQAWHRLGLARLRVGDAAGSRTALERARELAPDDPGPLTTLARLHSREGRTSEACSLYAQLLELQPDDAALKREAQHACR